MSIPAKYKALEVEEKWYDYWMENNYFHSTPDDRKPYTIVIPPPNVTGVLHMGHMLNNTIQDVLIRRKRMQGRRTKPETEQKRRHDVPNKERHDNCQERRHQ